jgi:NitT/TauT family transport system substrate-binding protein/putative hydroxymethylpyrimidine transport system substrate-binding protein
VRLTTIAIAALAAVAGAGCGDDQKQKAASRAEARPVTLALDFQPNAVHAGVYAAVRERLDRRHGVKLTVRAPSASTDSLKLLAAGRSDVSIVDIHDLGLARERGSDLVGVGAVVQRPLAAVVARGVVKRPRDLEGRRVGVTGLPSDDAVLRAVVESDGGDFGKVRRTTIGFSAVPSLVANKVDAVVTFWNAEGVALKQRGVQTREFRVDDFGAPRYPELVLVTKRRTLDGRRDLVRDTVSALADGTRAALSKPEAAVSDIVRVSGSDGALVEAQFRAVEPALQPPLQLDRSQLRRWARFDARFGILERPPDVQQAFPAVGR